MESLKIFISIFLIHFFVFQSFFTSNTSASDTHAKLPLTVETIDSLNLDNDLKVTQNSLCDKRSFLTSPTISTKLFAQNSVSGTINQDNSANTNPEKTNYPPNTDKEPISTIPFQLAEADFHAKRWANAIEKYKKFIELYPNAPNIPQAFLRLGNLYEETNFYDASNYFKKVIELSPRSKAAHKAKIALARLTYLTGDYQEVLNLLREVLHETRDWSTVKYATYLMKEIKLRMPKGDKGASFPSCGIKALAEVLKMKGKNVSAWDLSNNISQENPMVSLGKLKRIAKSQKVNAFGVRFNHVGEIKEVPLIAHLKANHFVVVTNIEGKNIRIIDPDRGESLLTGEEFQKRWSGYSLVFPGKSKKVSFSSFLGKDQLEKICGGHHIHGNNLGGPEGNAPVIFDHGPSSPYGCGKPGMPVFSVNLANLNFLVQDLDFIYSGRGPSVYVKRAFNADDPAEGIFGRSWTSNYEVHLEEDAGGNVTIKRESGKMDVFTPNGDGTYSYPRWVYDELKKNEDNTFDLKLKGSKIIQHFDSDGKLASITDRNGNAVILQYDGNDRLTYVTDTTGKKTTFTYNAVGKVSVVEDPAGRKALFYYDAGNNLIKTVDMAGNEVNYTYNEYSYMTSIIGSRGTTVIENTYYDNQFGYIVRSITDPAGNKKVYTVGSTLLYVTDANDNTTAYYVLTPNGETTAITDPLGNTVWRGLDSNANINSITDPNGNTTKLTYDKRGNILDITDPLGNKVQFTYDSEDNLKKITDPVGNIYEYEYDTQSNLKKIIDPVYGLKKPTTFTYNNTGELITLNNPKGNSTSFEYDTFGNVEVVTNPLGKKNFYSYDDIGRVKSHTDPNSNTIKYDYDGIDRIVKATYPDGFGKTYTYDCCGISSINDKNGMVTFTYYKNGIPESFTDVYKKTIYYDYDTVGNLKTLTYPDGKTVAYAYDKADRLIKVTDWIGNITQYEYDAAGNLVKILYPDGSIITHHHDEARRLTLIQDINTDGKVNALFRYVLDSLGNRTEIASYQPLYTTPKQTSISYTYNKDNQILTAGGITFEYDDNGNAVKKIIGDSESTYAWDYNNMLKQFVSGVNTNTFKYDGLGNRIAKIKNSVETRYVVDPSGGLSSVLAETDASGDITSYYVYGLGLISKITPDGKPYYYHYDGLGNTVAITNASGNIVNKYAYDAFGRILKQKEIISNPFKYVGMFGVMDEGNGLLYMRARYYDPVIGRFINKDPVGFAGGLNMYAYTGNNPVKRVDPLGLEYCEIRQAPPEKSNYDPWEYDSYIRLGYSYMPNGEYIGPKFASFKENMQEVGEFALFVNKFIPWKGPWEVINFIFEYLLEAKNAW